MTDDPPDQFYKSLHVYRGVRYLVRGASTLTVVVEQEDYRRTRRSGTPVSLVFQRTWELGEVPKSPFLFLSTLVKETPDDGPTDLGCLEPESRCAPTAG